jgi:hypothetical protein
MIGKKMIGAEKSSKRSKWLDELYAVRDGYG